MMGQRDLGSILKAAYRAAMGHEVRRDFETLRSLDNRYVSQFLGHIKKLSEDDKSCLVAALEKDVFRRLLGQEALLSIGEKEQLDKVKGGVRNSRIGFLATASNFVRIVLLGRVTATAINVSETSRRVENGLKKVAPDLEKIAGGSWVSSRRIGKVRLSTQFNLNRRFQTLSVSHSVIGPQKSDKLLGVDFLSFLGIGKAEWVYSTSGELDRAIEKSSIEFVKFVGMFEKVNGLRKAPR